MTLNITGDWSNGKGPKGFLTTSGHGKENINLVYGNSSETAVLNSVGAAQFQRREDGTVDLIYKAETLPGSSLIGRAIVDFEHTRGAVSFSLSSTRFRNARQ